MFSVLNLTEEALDVTLSGRHINPRTPVRISPSYSSTFTSSSWNAHASLELVSITGEPFRSKLTFPRRKMGSRRTWEFAQCDPASPWIAYKMKLSRSKHHLIILPKRSLASFLADIPSSVPLSSLMLPGTHESVSFYGWPLSQCQDQATPLATQLTSGIRALDIRLSVINGALISYHGIYPQRLPFLDILGTVHAFLISSEGKTETVVMSIKQEDQASDLFSQLVHSAVHNGPGGKDMWFLENKIPTLGEVRGKIVMFSRFGGDGKGWEGGLEGLGIHPTTWPDSQPSGFDWWLKGTKVNVHDWYSIQSFLAIPEKATRSSQVLLQVVPGPDYPVLPIAFLSASSFPLALPPIIACGFGWPAWGLGVEGVNPRVGKWILSLLAGNTTTEKATGLIGRDVQTDTKGDTPSQQSGQPRLRGWCFMDYYRHPVDVGLVALLVECNYRGRKAGEEGWQAVAT